MEEKNITSQEYLSDKEAKEFKGLYERYLAQYRNKDKSMSDKEWLAQLFINELPSCSVEEAKKDASEIVETIEEYDQNLKSVTDASEHGISKEAWLSQKISEASIGHSVNEYGKILKSYDDFLYQKNAQLAEALSRSSDGNIMMSPNLDGNIAENMIANTTEASAFLQGKHIKVEVREVFSSNSVDVRATNLDTGKYQNYQLKFGQDAKATISLIERGNYNNQRIVVPSEQLAEVQAYFKSKGSEKTITDHIEAWGVKGKSFTKDDMKKLQLAAQEDNVAPSMDYSHYQAKDYAMSIAKNSCTLALQSAAVTTGLEIAKRAINGEEIDPNELVEIAVKTGADTSLKVVTAGTLQVAIRKGIISFIPKATPAGVIANIACVGIENFKILTKIASGDLSVTKGLDHMGRTTVSMVGGLAGMAKGAALGASATSWIPVVGPALSVVTGFVGGMVGYFGGSKLGDMVYNAGKKVAGAVKSVAKAAFNGLKTVCRTLADGVKSIAGFLGL